MLQSKAQGSWRDKKKDTYICCLLQEALLRMKIYTGQKWKDVKIYFMQLEKTAVITIVISHKIDFKIKAMVKTKKDTM